MFRKVLVANRGEIAIRAFRAAYELGISTVAVFPYEDRNSLHRAKADESYQIGEPGHPVRAYLSVDEVIKAAQRAGADAIYPGYGFLSENPELAAGVRAGRHHVRRPAGRGAAPDRQQVPRGGRGPGGRGRGAGLVGALDRRRRAGRGGRRRSGSRCSSRRWPAAAGGACAGSSGPGELRESIEAAMREAESAFGDATVFLEQAVVNPRHIEVQILADARGQRRRTSTSATARCSAGTRRSSRSRRRPTSTRSCGTGSAPTRSRSRGHIGYVNAGTVEFLLDERGQHHFIEMNPRIQVEHTVTEQVTDRDLVIAQLRIAAGSTLPELYLTQDKIRINGTALQCRVTTEDPANGFRPDTGVISAYRSPGGPGVRLDGGTTHSGAEVSAHFDSMLVKLTCYGHSFPNAVRRARRAIAEFRIRGVSTNLPFLAAVLSDPDFQAGRLSTSFIDERPQLLSARRPADRGTRVLTYLAETTVNRPNGPRPEVVEPVDKLPRYDLSAPAPDGSRQLLAALGPEGFAARLREQRGGGRHRHHVPRRAPVAAGHPGAHPGPAGRGAVRGAHRPAAAVPGVLGRGDLRRGAALPGRGPVGPAGRSCARRCPTSAPRCCCAGATPSATRRTRPR